MKVPTVTVFDVPISKMTMAQTVSHLTEAIRKRDNHHVVTANPIIMMAGLNNPEFHRMLQTVELVVPDGTGLVWAAKELAEGVQERVAGYDLMHELLRVGERYRWKVFLLGASEEVNTAAAERITQLYPKVEMLQGHHGFFDETGDARILQMIADAKPDLLFVARGADNQDIWIQRHRDRLDVPLMMGVGGSLDVISGRTKRAPLFFQKLRVEWLYRLLSEPTRYKRMLDLPRFVQLVRAEKKRLKRGKSEG